MPADPQPSTAAEWASLWLDVDEPASGAPLVPESLTDEQRQRDVADLLWIDALLAGCAAGEDERGEARIKAALRRIDVSATAVAPPSAANAVSQGRRWLASSLAVAAGLALSCTLFWATMIRETRAEALLRVIGEVSRSGVDRIYRVVRTSPRLASGEAAVGKLYLRGAVGFVLECPEAALGRHGADVWVAPPTGPALVADNFAALLRASDADVREIELLEGISTVALQAPLMELSSMIELLRHDYEVAVVRAAAAGAEHLVTLDGTLRSADGPLPTRIRLWAHRDSHVIERAELTWDGGDLGVEDLQLQFTQLPAVEVADDWYRYSSHCLPEQEVREIRDGGPEGPSAGD